MSYQLLVIQGRLTKDPELRTTGGGTTIASFTVAVDGYKPKDSDERPVEFFSCKAFGARAEVIDQYFKKGDGIFVQGRIQTEKWNDKETGEKKYKTVAIVDAIDFPPSKVSDRQEAAEEEEEEAPTPPPRRPAKPAPKQATKPQQRRPAPPAEEQDDSSEEFDDDVPF
jgi:single-strand DNA-binding protein